jgi:hypothetical protein
LIPEEAPMPEQPQTFKNHVRLDPVFHFFLVPSAGFFVVYAAFVVIRRPTMPDALFLFMSVVFLVTLFKMRIYALKVQDRVIRLEERLRMEGILREPLRSRIGELTEAQFVALRFAPDAELPTLIEQALANHWTGKQIKEAIREWRADDFRV